MATTAVDGASDRQQGAVGWLRAAVAWHLFLAVAAAAGALYLVQAPWPEATWARLLAVAILLLTIVGSGAAAVLTYRRRHAGRTLSLALNYLGALTTAVLLLHLVGTFLAIDALAANFARGIPWLVLLVVGLLVYNSGGALHDRVARTRREWIGRALAWFSALAFLFAVGLLTALQAVIARLVDSPALLALLAAALLFGVMAWALWRQPAADAFDTTNAQSEMLQGYLFLSPNLLGFLIFFAGPLLFSLYVSFTDSDAFGNAQWIGLQNYAEIVNITLQPLESADQLVTQVLDTDTYVELTRFSILGRHYVVGAQDKLFWIALGNTLQYVLMVVPLSVIPALFLANLLNSKIPGMKFFRAAYFLPSVAAVVGIALIWQWLYNATVGYINYFITTAVNFANMFLGLALTDPQIRWTSSADTALIAVAIMAAWQMLGFNTILFLAGLQSIPNTLYEAAIVDGAGSWSRFTKITLPLLAPTTFFVLVTTLIKAMQAFEEVFILMGMNPTGPGNSTLTMVLYLYQKGFQRFDLGYASALAWVLFLLIFGLTLVQFRRQRAGGSTFDM
ncbi:MAG: sugar ABC transporter permease [Candidatus Promineifilaceae bacterium]|nr:sugar ABC transporter permease [Candidatus Promineifilaceae bacterium]